MRRLRRPTGPHRAAMRPLSCSLFRADGATINDLREAVTTIEDTERIARRVLGGAHPLTVNIERNLQKARAALAAREGGDVSAVRVALDAMKAT